VRHGLTAETVIGALEDAEDYRAFEAAITADYDAQSAVERELVLRLASPVEITAHHDDGNAARTNSHNGPHVYFAGSAFSC
jgi:hypothetical protein